MPAKRRIMHELIISEISAVDKAAQKPARAVLIKREGDVLTFEEIAKRGKAALTTAVDDHSHLVSLEDYEGFPVSSGTTSWQTSNDKKGYGHSHPWIMTEEGDIIVGEVDGHTHTIDAVSKSYIEKRLAGISMPGGRYPIRNRRDLDAVVKAFERATEPAPLAAHIAARARALKLDAALPTSGPLATALSKATETGAPTMPGETDLQKQLDASNNRAGVLIKALAALLLLSPDAHAHVAKLGETERDAFLAKSKPEQEAIVQDAIAKSRDLNPVAFTAADGTVYRKNDDPRLIAMAKQADANADAFRKAQRVAEDSEFAKRAASDLGNLAGTEVVKIAILRAIEKGEGIADATVRADALTFLKSADGAVKLSKSFGHRGGGDPARQSEGDTPVAKLEALTKSRMEKTQEPYVKAYNAVLETAEGRALYAQTTTAPGAGVH